MGTIQTTTVDSTDQKMWTLYIRRWGVYRTEDVDSIDKKMWTLDHNMWTL
jgi:hypothetical protein